MDCLSSNCNKDVYSRGVCEKTNGESANCECTTKYDDKYGDITTRCLPVSKWKKEADAPEKPTYEYFMDNESLFNNKNLKFTVCEHHKYQGVALGATPSEWDVCNTYTKVTSSPYYSLTANIVFAGTDHVQNSGSIGYSNLDEEEFKSLLL